MRRKLTVLHAHASRENVGDDAIVVAVQALLRSASGNADVNFVSVCVDDRSVRGEGVSEHINLNKISRLSTWSYIVRAVSRADFVVIGGGELIFGAVDFMLLVPLARLLGTPVIFVGIGADDHQMSPLTRAYTIFALRAATRFYIRDAEAGEVLMRLRVPSHKITWSADVVFALPGPATEPEVNGKKRSIGLVLRSTQRVDRALTPARLTEIANSVSRLARERDAEVHLYPFIPYATESAAVDDVVDDSFKYDLPYSDSALMDIVASKLGSDIRVVCHEHKMLRPAATIDQFTGHDLIISMRLHGLILAALAGTPFIGINYADKIARVMAEIDASRQVVPIDIFDDATTSIDRLDSAIEAAEKFDRTSLNAVRERLESLVDDLHGFARAAEPKRIDAWRQPIAYGFLAMNSFYFWLVRSKHPLLLGLARFRRRLASG